jgi:hypothetical protein
MIEAQLEYAMACLEAMDRGGLATLEIREDVQEGYDAEVQDRSQGTVWLSGGCSSRYLTADGRNATPWPDLMAALEKRTRRFNLGEHVVTPTGTPAPAAA